jgi:hypothetical protein
MFYAGQVRSQFNWELVGELGVSRRIVEVRSL